MSIVILLLILCFLMIALISNIKDKINVFIINNKTLLQIQKECPDKTIVEQQCPKCKCNYCNTRQDEYGIMYNCYYCKNLIKYDKLKETTISFNNSTNQIKCPYCNSTNLKKISTTSKVASTAVFGLAAMGKVNSNWHCNNCKSDF